MTTSIEQIVSKHKTGLAERDATKLRENLKLLEDECKLELRDREQNEAKLLRCLWLKLSVLAIRQSNIELCLLIAAKLKLFQLVSLLKSLTSQQKPTKISFAIALSYARSLFQASEEDDPFDSITEDDIKNCQPSAFKELIELHLNSNDPHQALESIETRYKFDRKCCESQRCIILHKLAQHLEAEENFAGSLAKYEEAGSSASNLTRVLIKQHPQSAHHHLRNYMFDNKSVRQFWKDYLHDSGNHEELKHLHSVTNDQLAMIRFRSNRNNCKEIDEFMGSILTKTNFEFVIDKSHTKWNDKRKLDLVASFGSGLEDTSRQALAELSLHYERVGRWEISTGLLLHLEQINLLVNRVAQSSGNLSGVKLAGKYGASRLAMANDLLIDHLIEKPTRVNDLTKANKSERVILFESYSKLGLMDEALAALSSDLDDSIVLEVVEFLGKSIESQAQGSLDCIDPELSSSTLSNLKLSINNNPILSTNEIVIVILCTTILLRKLENSNHIYSNNTEGEHEKWVAKLEVMFQHLADFSSTLDLVASDELVKTTSNLINALKEKLDLLSDSKVIRQSFQRLVDEMASRCMVEGKYKSAAILYSQIEDNVSAVKSLMRTGDVEDVIDFSLLVKDITVNRVTINYLKHLRVDAEIIDDFISKCNS